MLLSYIKIALRNILKNKLHSTINIICLSVGMASAIFLLLYVRDELAYDKHHEKWEQIYRLEAIWELENGPIKVAGTSLPMGVALRDEYPQICEVVRFLPVERELYIYNNKDFFEENFYYSDPTVFNIFDHRFLKGDITDALKIPDTMVMTESLSKKYFGDEYPIGKVIRDRHGKSIKVTGVIEDLPGNSHLKFDALISMETLVAERDREYLYSRAPDRFLGGAVFTYLLMDKSSTINTVFEDFDRFRVKYLSGATNGIVNSLHFDATPLVKTHFRSDILNDRPHGNIMFVYMLAVLAFLILIISSINYINLATVTTSKREKEVGIRKVMGAFKGQLIKQFLVESTLFALLSFLLSMVLTEMLFPIFKQISGKDLNLFSPGNTSVIGLAFLLSILIGISSGGYPAFYLSQLSPSKILGHTTISLRKSGFLRNTLVIAQFSISTGVIIATIIVFQQSDYMKHKDLGFEKEDIIVQQVGYRGASIEAPIDILKNELKRSPFVIDTAASTESLNGTIAGVPLRIEVDRKMQEMLMCIIAADYNYFDLMGIEIKEGRAFNPDLLTDQKNAFIVNETAAKQAGWGGNAIGKRIQLDLNSDGRLDGPNDMDGKVIGVARDFHFEELRNKIDPCVILLSNESTPVNSIAIKIQPGKTAEALSYIDEKTRALNSGFPPDYFFLEKRLSELYRDEERLVKILGSFSIISILISCGGLFGLSSYVTEQRTKEIGIRKVLGAGISNIIYLLSREFLLLVLVANIVAWSVAGIVMHRWLENFAYRIDLGVSSFALAALAALLIAFFTVGFQALKAAYKDPVKALKYE